VRNLLRLIPLAAAAFASVATSAPPVDNPEPERCTSPDTVAADDLGVHDDYGAELLDGDALPLTWDDVDSEEQVALMLRLSGGPFAGTPCVDETLTVTARDGEILAAEGRPLVFHAGATGEHLDAVVYLPRLATPPFGVPALLSATVAGKTVRRRLIFAPPYACVRPIPAITWSEAGLGLGDTDDEFVPLGEDEPVAVVETWPGVPELVVRVRAAGATHEAPELCLGDEPLTVRDAEGFELGRARLPGGRLAPDGSRQADVHVLLTRRPAAGERLVVTAPVDGLPQVASVVVAP